jgi:hypothetical protein
MHAFQDCTAVVGTGHRDLYATGWLIVFSRLRCRDVGGVAMVWCREPPVRFKRLLNTCRVSVSLLYRFLSYSASLVDIA